MGAMWIKALRVRNFGALGTREFSFSEGINLIYGPNEAGKTTLFEAIERALLEGARLLRNYNGEAEVLIVTEEGERWIGSRRSRRPSALKAMRQRVFENLYFIRTGEVVFKDQQDLLRDLKGRLLDTGRLYQAMDHIREKLGRDLNPLGERAKKEGTLSLELEKLRGELEELEDKERLLMEARTDLRRLEILKEKCSKLTQQWDDLKRKVEVLKKVYEKRSLRDRYKTLLKERDEAKEAEEIERKLARYQDFDPAQLEVLKGWEDTVQKASERIPFLKKNLRELEGELRRQEEILKDVLREADGVRNRKKELSSEIEGLKGLEEGERLLAEKRGEIEALQRELQGLERTIAEVEERRRWMEGAAMAARTQATSLERLQKAAWALIGGGLLTGFLSLYLPKELLVLGVAAVALGILGGTWCRRRKAILAEKDRELQGKLAEVEGQLADLREGKEKAEEELRRLQQEFQSILQRAGVADEDAYLKRLKEHQELKEELTKLQVRHEEVSKRIDELRQYISELEKKIEGTKRELQKAEEDKERAERQIDEALRALGLRSIRDLEEKVRERVSLQERLRALRSRGSRSRAEIEQQLRDLEVRLKELGDIPSFLPEEQEIEFRLKEVQDQVLRYQKEIHQLEGRIEERERSIGLTDAELFRRIGEVRQQLRKKEEEWRDLFEIFRLLKELEGRLEGELIELLEGQTMEWFRFILGRGDPLTIRLEGTNIKISIEGQTLGAKELSSGTRDPLYFAARVAIAERVKGLKTLLLDDPFLTCDPPRTERLVELLARLAERFQILLATKDPWLRDLVLRRGAHEVKLLS